MIGRLEALAACEEAAKEAVGRIVAVLIGAYLVGPEPDRAGAFERARRGLRLTREATLDAVALIAAEFPAENASHA